jgi:hypothetical protein
MPNAWSLDGSGFEGRKRTRLRGCDRLPQMSPSRLLRGAALFATLAGSLLAPKPVMTEDFI